MRSCLLWHSAIACFPLVDLCGIVSTSHFSFSPQGVLVGCYGHDMYDQRTNTKVRKRCKHNMHVPRQLLRLRLLRALLPDTVRWGMTYDYHIDMGDDARTAGLGANTLPQHADSVPEDSLECSKTVSTPGTSATFTVATPAIDVRFKDGTSVKCDMLVGADGIFSAVRACKMSTRPSVGPGTRADDAGETKRPWVSTEPCSLNYVGLVVVLGYTRCDHPLVSRRIFQTLDGETRIYAMPFADHAMSEELGLAGLSPGEESTMWQLSFSVSDIDAARMLCKSPDLLRAEALRRCATWHAPIPQLLASTEDFAMSGYPVFDRDPLDADDLRTGGGSTRSTSPVTLIGDAVSSLAPGLLCPDGKSWNYQLCSQTVSMCKWLQAQ
eukprot:m.61667 g.61667  ORF g.61667 m.61667 type:complete len:381 (-) comp15762_c0_seq19:199-1341(-)